MMLAVNFEKAKQSRKTRTEGWLRWRTEMMGKPGHGAPIHEPEVFLTEMSYDTTITPHFHQVDQFQVFVAGGGSMGRHATPVVAVHYVDHHTAYGPIDSGPLGLSFFTLRVAPDPGSVHLDKPGYKDLLQPSKKRYFIADDIGLSTGPVLQNRSEVSLENLTRDVDVSDGLGTRVLRMGAGAQTRGPDPASTGGQFHLVLNGSLRLDDADYPPWSVVHVGSTDGPLTLCAGEQGVEVLIMDFPRGEA